MTKETIEVIYVYEKIPAKVIVKYIEKETEKELLKEDIIEGIAGEEYNTQRKPIENYKKAEPEPKNAEGKMTKETIEVIYYYEKIPSGEIQVKHVDIDTEEEIQKENKETYGSTIKGYVGEKYKTKEENIPYYKYVKATNNKEGTLTQTNDTVIYYYRKLKFDISVEKTIAKLKINGEEQNIKNNKTAKIEIKGNEIAKTNIEVEYKIEVRNEEEIAGKAVIEELIPEGFEIAEESKENWQKEENGKYKTEIELKPGETKELTITLKWKPEKENFGTKTNKAIIAETENKANYEETNQMNNQSEAEVIIGIQTGPLTTAETENAVLIALIISSIIAAGIISKKIAAHC